MKDPSHSYRTDRLSALARFDEVETTISHLFRRPHPALKGRTYGAALYAGLEKHGLIASGRELDLVELGAGSGLVAQAFADARARAGLGLRATFIDLSRVLLSTQRSRLPGASAVLANAERLPLSAGSVRGLFLANEVIADLRVLSCEEPEARALKERYGLRCDDNELLNVGAIHLLEELARVLAPGASAVLTEFGGDFSPGGVDLEGPLGSGRHREHSIHFGHLEAAARALGFSVERVLLCELLEIDQTARVASYADVRRLRRLIPSLPVLAHPKEELELRHPILTRLFHFDFPPIADPRFPSPTTHGGFCQLFFALLLRRRTDDQAVPG